MARYLCQLLATAHASGVHFSTRRGSLRRAIGARDNNKTKLNSFSNRDEIFSTPNETFKMRIVELLCSGFAVASALEHGKDAAEEIRFLAKGLISLKRKGEVLYDEAVTGGNISCIPFGLEKYDGKIEDDFVELLESKGKWTYDPQKKSTERSGVNLPR
eukprot:GHVN01041510.1.p1 GENE.GHVN01041510.1~~GHVN01041510.1.p1  ORF type:complete len:159 (+),score=13.45 GHVN01041510.1:424-900(+)